MRNGKGIFSLNSQYSNPFNIRYLTFQYVHKRLKKYLIKLKKNKIKNVFVVHENNRVSHMLINSKNHVQKNH